jgi:hypothetical protein
VLARAAWASHRAARIGSVMSLALSPRRSRPLPPPHLGDQPLQLLQLLGAGVRGPEQADDGLVSAPSKTRSSSRPASRSRL